MPGPEWIWVLVVVVVLVAVLMACCGWPGAADLGGNDRHLAIE